MASIWDWSGTAASNSNADSGINWAEGQLPSTVNDSARVMMKRVADFLDDLGCKTTTTGSANAYLLASNAAFSSYSSGLLVGFQASFANTGNATLNVNSIGAKHIMKGGRKELVGNEIETNGNYVCIYDASANGGAGAWLLINSDSGNRQYFADGSAANPSISNDDDQDTGFYFSAANEVSVSLGGAQAFVFQGNNSSTAPNSKLGIGKAAPTANVHVLAFSSIPNTTWEQYGNTNITSFDTGAGTTIANATTITAGSNIGRIRFRGMDGSGTPAFAESARIDVLVPSTSTVGTSGRVAGQISFWTTPDAASPSITERVRINEVGTLWVVGQAAVSSSFAPANGGLAIITSTPSGSQAPGVNADDMVITTGGNTGMTLIHSGNTGVSTLNFDRSGGANPASAATIKYTSNAAAAKSGTLLLQSETDLQLQPGTIGTTGDLFIQTATAGSAYITNSGTKPTNTIGVAGGSLTIWTSTPSGTQAPGPAADDLVIATSGSTGITLFHSGNTGVSTINFGRTGGANPVNNAGQLKYTSNAAAGNTGTLALTSETDLTATATAGVVTVTAGGAITLTCGGNGDATVTAAGSGNVILTPGGTGFVKFGTNTVKAAEAFASYITIKDAGGTSRKLMVCA